MPFHLSGHLLPSLLLEAFVLVSLFRRVSPSILLCVSTSAQVSIISVVSFRTWTARCVALCVSPSLALSLGFWPNVHPEEKISPELPLSGSDPLLPAVYHVFLLLHTHPRLRSLLSRHTCVYVWLSVCLCMLPLCDPLKSACSSPSSPCLHLSARPDACTWTGVGLALEPTCLRVVYLKICRTGRVRVCGKGERFLGLDSFASFFLNVRVVSVRSCLPTGKLQKRRKRRSGKVRTRKNICSRVYIHRMKRDCTGLGSNFAHVFASFSFFFFFLGTRKTESSTGIEISFFHPFFLCPHLSLCFFVFLLSFSFSRRTTTGGGGDEGGRRSFWKEGSGEEKEEDFFTDSHHQQKSLFSSSSSSSSSMGLIFLFDLDALRCIGWGRAHAHRLIAMAFDSSGSRLATMSSRVRSARPSESFLLGKSIGDRRQKNELERKNAKQWESLLFSFVRVLHFCRHLWKDLHRFADGCLFVRKASIQVSICGSVLSCGGVQDLLSGEGEEG